MAKKTIEERIQDLMDSADAESQAWESGQYRAFRLSSGLAKGRMSLRIKERLAKDSARAEHAIALAQAQLIASLAPSELRELQAARAMLATAKVPLAVEESPAVDAATETAPEATVQ